MLQSPSSNFSSETRFLSSYESNCWAIKIDPPKQPVATSDQIFVVDGDFLCPIAEILPTITI